MQRTSVVTFVALITVGFVQGNDKCMPPKPGEKHVHAWECCKVNNFIPEAVKNSAQKCMEKYPKPPRPSGSPPSGDMLTPNPAMKIYHSCMGECAFSDNGLLTADKKIDKAAVTKFFTTTDKDLSPVLTAAVSKCLGSYQNNIDQSLECKSGAEELNSCIAREIFLNCPSTLLNASTECGELKTKLTKCPNISILMKGGSGPHPN